MYPHKLYSRSIYLFLSGKLTVSNRLVATNWIEPCNNGIFLYQSKNLNTVNFWYLYTAEIPNRCFLYCAIIFFIALFNRFGRDCKIRHGETWTRASHDAFVCMLTGAICETLALNSVPKTCMMCSTSMSISKSENVLLRLWLIETVIGWLLFINSVHAMIYTCTLFYKWIYL